MIQFMNMIFALFALLSTSTTAPSVPSLYWTSSLPLEIARTAHQRNALIHDDLSDPEVVVNPFLELRLFAEIFGAKSRAGELVSRAIQVCPESLMGASNRGGEGESHRGMEWKWDEWRRWGHT